MPKYLLVYHGGTIPQSEEEGVKVMAAWMGWIGKVGAGMVDSGNPVGKSWTINPDRSVVKDGGVNPVSGWSVISAGSYEDAVEIAKDCPQLDSDGTIELAEIMEMD